MENISFDTKVNSSSIWATSPDYEDKGCIPGLLRGYNIEVKALDGKVFWLSCEYIHGEPENHYNDDFHHWLYEDSGWTPTGRITFRGYAYEEYSERIGNYVVSCNEKGERIL